MTVIGLGEAGCNIAEMFEQSNNYSIKLIDNDIEGENCYAIKKCKSPEEYEISFPDISNFLNDVEDDVLFIVGGGGNISGATLKLLSQIKEKRIYILYIKPDEELLGTVAKLQDNLVFNVLQEYTRSGVFAGMMIVKNSELELLAGNTTIRNYYPELNKIVFNTINTLFISSSKKGIYENFSQPRQICCLGTYGVYDLETDNEKLFFDLQNIEDKAYYFFINSQRLENDGELFKNIKNSMKKKVVDNTKISYIIYPTDSNKDFCYVTAFSARIQK